MRVELSPAVAQKAEQMRLDGEDIRRTILDSQRSGRLIWDGAERYFCCARLGYVTLWVAFVRQSEDVLQAVGIYSHRIEAEAARSAGGDEIGDAE